MNCQPTDFRPIFIVGNSRSGTTLMANILRGNEEVYAFPELHFFERLWDVDSNSTLGRSEAVELVAKLMHTIRERYTATSPWQTYLDEAAQIVDSTHEGLSGFDVYRKVLSMEGFKCGKGRVCDQTPRNVFYLTDLLVEYPDSRVLIMTRDPRAILLSQKNKWKRREIRGKPIQRVERLRRWANYHPIVTSALWNAAINAGQRVATDPRVKIIHFENLVTQPEKTVLDICQFLGLVYSPLMLEVGPSMSPTGSRPAREGRAIDASVAHRWKADLSLTDTYWCERANGENMRGLGYSLSQVSPKWPALCLSLISLPFKAGLSAILNGGKMRNILRSIRRRFLS